ncbi:MAG TPA: ABC transporter permease [Acidimicrobiales bacterium]|nr:ABC transporter permease [Acidimicrobiales bacterium]
MTTIASTAPATTRSRAARRVGLSTSTKVLLGLLGAMVLMGLFGTVLAPYSTTATDPAHRLLPAFTRGHVLGTDGLGRDVWSRLIVGTRLSLLTGFIPVIVAALIGCILGMWAGVGGRFANTVIMRVLDVFYAFPTVLLAIAINASLGPSVRNAIIALSVVLIPPIARVMEAAASSVAREEFVESAFCSGASKPRVAFSQVLPNVTAQVLVYCTSLVGLSIIEAAGLSFLGLGASPPIAEWGLMLNDGRDYFFNAPMISLTPAIAIVLSSLLFNALGDRLRSDLHVNSREAV